MKGTFDTTEVVHLLNIRVPRGRRPKFRLQNFLFGREDWKTSLGGSLHIGEAGELVKLRRILGTKRLRTYERIFNKHSDRSSAAGNALRFPTQKHYLVFVKEVVAALGKKITLDTEAN